MSEGICNHLTAKSPSLYHDDDILLIIPYGMYWSEVRPEDLIGKSHCVKSVRIRSFSVTHLPEFIFQRHSCLSYILFI